MEKSNLKTGMQVILRGENLSNYDYIVNGNEILKRNETSQSHWATLEEYTNYLKDSDGNEEYDIVKVIDIDGETLYEDIEEETEVEKAIKILEEKGHTFRYDGGWDGYFIDEETDGCVMFQNEDDFLEHVKEYYSETESNNEDCWSCKGEINEYCYSPTIYYLDETEESIEDIITGMTEQDMEDYENEVKKEYENVDYVEFGEFCPHCLACM